MENVFKNPSFNYLDCRKIQIFNYLLQKGTPINYLLYNALESTDKVLQSVLVERRRKWAYFSNLLMDKSIEELHAEFVPFHRLADVKELLLKLLSQNIAVFVWCDPKHLIHNPFTDLSYNHSVLITEYINDQNIKVSDIPQFPDLNYSFEELAKMADHAFPQNKYLFYLHIDNAKISPELIDSLHSNLHGFIDRIQDSFAYYEYISHLFHEDKKVTDELLEVIPYLDDSLSIIAGSRFLFAKSLLEFGFWEMYYNLYMEIAKKIESLKLQIAKIPFSKRYDYTELIRQIKRIRIMEHDALNLLKEKRSVESELEVKHTFGEKLREPNSPILHVISENTSRLVWDEPEESVWIVGYDIYKDGELIDSSRTRQLNLQNIDPQQQQIMIASKDVFNNSSKAVIVSDIKFMDRASGSENLALHKSVFASSVEHEDFNQNNVVDGTMETRWSSVPEEKVSWIYVDLGKDVSISKIVLVWEQAYAKSYRIQISHDAKQWSDSYETVASKGGTENIDLNVRAKFIKVLCEEKATSFGYSIWNIFVYS